MTGWNNARYIAGAAGLTSSVSTLFPEEAVNEVKRQAMSELQKAVSEAERKAHEMISSERAKMERTVAEAKRQAAEDALIIINQQEDSSEVGKPGGFWSRWIFTRLLRLIRGIDAMTATLWLN